MRWDRVRERLERRLRETGINKAEASRSLGRSPGFVHDFLTGKQRTLGDDDVQKLAKMLKVRETWLLSIDEFLEGGAQKPAPPAAATTSGLTMNHNNIESVNATEKHDVGIISLDIRSGVCTLATTDSQQISGKIVDPALFQANNPYGMAFINRQGFTAFVKRVMMKDKTEIWYIIDSE